jgi:hypothetical protein
MDKNLSTPSEAPFALGGEIFILNLTCERKEERKEEKVK